MKVQRTLALLVVGMVAMTMAATQPSLAAGKKAKKKNKKVTAISRSTADTLKTTAASPDSPSSVSGSAPVTSQGTSEAKEKKTTDYLALSYSGDFSGPSIASPTEGRRTTVEGDKAGPLKLYNSFSIGGRPAPNTKLLLIPRFEWYLTRGGNDGENVRLLDPRIGITKADLITSGGYSLFGMATLQLGYFTETSQSKNSTLGPGIYLENSYAVPQTRATVGLDFAMRMFFYTAAPTDKTIEDVTYYIAPWAAYTVSPKVEAKMVLELEGLRQNDPQIATLQAFEDEQRMLLGASWKPISAVSLFPYVAIPFHGPPDAVVDATSVGLQISGTVF